MSFDPDRYTNLIRYTSKMRDEWKAEEQRMRSLFENDAEKEFGFYNLPQNVRELIHSKAWEDGHSSGYSEVWNQYPDLVEIALAAYTEGQKP